jgi:hypothetical protein
MKTLIFSFIFVLATTLGFAQTNPKTTVTEKVDKAVKSQLENLLVSYFDLKDALVETNAKKAAEKAQSFLTILTKVDVAKMTTSQASLYKKNAQSLKLDAEHIHKNTSDVESQREHFETLSISMLALIKTFKPNTTPVYQQFCPMAFDNKGAFWLSDQKQVMNPYFGNKMLHCGSVKGEY